MKWKSSREEFSVTDNGQVSQPRSFTYITSTVTFIPGGLLARLCGSTRVGTNAASRSNSSCRSRLVENTILSRLFSDGPLVNFHDSLLWISCGQSKRSRSSYHTNAVGSLGFIWNVESKLSTVLSDRATDGLMLWHLRGSMDVGRKSTLGVLRGRSPGVGRGGPERAQESSTAPGPQATRPFEDCCPGTGSLYQHRDANMPKTILHSNIVDRDENLSH